MSESQNQQLLSNAWKMRNQLYSELFGDYAFALPKRYEVPVAPESSFKANADKKDGSSQLERFFTPDMSAQRVTVLAYAPTEARQYWTYVTSGLSNPWFQEEADVVSGFGCELMIKSKTPARWPIKMLRRMAFYILSYSGTLSPGVIINMETPLKGKDGNELNNIFVWYADEAPDCWYELSSGGFGLFCTVGITEDECVFAETVKEYGTWCIQEVLRRTGIGQITDPDRGSIMQRKNIEYTLENIRAYADNFRALEQQQRP